MKNRFDIYYFLLSLLKSQFGKGFISRNGKAIPIAPTFLQITVIKVK